MIKIHKKTLQDLEFPTVLQQVSEFCITPQGHAKTLAIEPISSKDDLLISLSRTSEYLASFDNENRIPNHGFETIDNELKLLGIENSFIEVHGLKKLVNISTTKL